MKIFFKTVLTIIVIILTTTWTANADDYDASDVYDGRYGFELNNNYTENVSKFLNYYMPYDGNGDWYPYIITYLGGMNVNNTNIDTVNKVNYYNMWFDKSEKWSAHTTYFLRNPQFLVKVDERFVGFRRNTYTGKDVPIYEPVCDTISLADPRIENLEFYIGWKSHRLGVNGNYKIDVRAKWVNKEVVDKWQRKAEKRGHRYFITDIDFANDVVGDYYIIKDEAEPKSENADYDKHRCYDKGSDNKNAREYYYGWNYHGIDYDFDVTGDIKVQIPTDYTKNDVLCLSLGGGNAGGYILGNIGVKFSFTFNPNKTDNNAKPEAITETHANIVTDNAYYDFTGRKIAYPQSGHTYIHNGKLIRFKKEE